MSSTQNERKKVCLLSVQNEIIIFILTARIVLTQNEIKILDYFILHSTLTTQNEIRISK